MNQFTQKSSLSFAHCLFGFGIVLTLCTGCGSDTKDKPKEDAVVSDVISDIGDTDTDVHSASDIVDVSDDSSTNDTVANDTTTTDSGAQDTEADSQLGDVIEDISADVTQDTLQSNDIEEDVEEDTAIPLDPCVPECGEGELCTDGLCLKDCGPSFDALALKESLADGVEVVTNICTQEPFSFIPLSQSSFLELSLESSSPTSYMYLNQVDYNEGVEPTVTFLSGGELPGNIDSFEVFPNDYLSIDTFKEVAIFGYVGSFAQGMNGSVFMADLMQPGIVPMAIDAPGHFQATVVDSTTVLVNGQGVAGTNQGPGIYRLKTVDGQTTVTKAATNLGIGGGVIAVHGTIVLLSGHADPWPTECNGVPVLSTVQGTRIFVTDLNALFAAADAGTPIDAFCNMEKVALPSEIIFHPGGDVLGRDVDSGNYLSRYSLTKIANGKVFITGTQKLAIGPAISGGRGVLGSNLVALSHSHGYLIVQ